MIVELSKEQEEELIDLISNHPKLEMYNRIRFELFGHMQFYENYREDYGGWEDKKINFDKCHKVHWFEFLIKVVLDLDMVKTWERDDYFYEIFIEDKHPLEVFKKYLK